jgi:hypothetical protein
MDQQLDPRREKAVKLVARLGETSVFIDAGIDEKGNLLLSGQDVGKAPEEWFGDSDYEYWVVVAASDKERVLCILLGQLAGGQQLRPAGDASEDEKDWALLTAIEKTYGGDLRAVSAFCDLLKANGIRYEFHTW